MLDQFPIRRTTRKRSDIYTLAELVNDNYSGRSCCLTGICYRNFLSF